MANISMLKNHHVVNSLNNSCLSWPRMEPKRKKSWCNGQQKENVFSYLCDQNLRAQSVLNSSGWMIINAKNGACAEGFKDLTALMNGSLLISIFELSQEFRRICMLRTELKGSAVDSLQVGTTTYLLYDVGILLCPSSLSNCF